MRSLILTQIARGMLPVTLLFSVYLLLHGHNAPGGGFVAGLVNTLAATLMAISFGWVWTRRQLYQVVRWALTLGLVIALVSVCLPMLAGQPFFTHAHVEATLPGGAQLPLSTALLFDIGVYLTVFGTTGTAVATLARVGE